MALLSQKTLFRLGFTSLSCFALLVKIFLNIIRELAAKLLVFLGSFEK